MLKTLKRFIKGKFKTLFTIFILSLPVVTLIILVTGKGISGERLYAGYYHYAEERESCSRKGVYGKIYTIDPSIPGENFIAEWVTVILSYRPLYWVQVGYTKGYDTDYNLIYYCEKYDYYEYWLHFISPGPNPGTWHRYAIVLNPSLVWEFYIDGSLVYADASDPIFPVDEQASVETTTSLIAIDGSHFKALGYYLSYGSNRSPKPCLHLSICIVSDTVRFITVSLGQATGAVLPSPTREAPIDS